jgi:hypothetical protein
MKIAKAKVERKCASCKKTVFVKLKKDLDTGEKIGMCPECGEIACIEKTVIIPPKENPNP